MTCLRIFAITTLISALILNKVYYDLMEEDDLPEVIERNWGTKKNCREIRKFTINISDEILSDLKHRLQYDKLPKPLPGEDNEYGLNQKALLEFRDYWLNNYNWRKREVYLNKYPQYITTIQGLDIHFVHIKPDTTKRRIPLLMLHGWPGSFSENYNMVPSLIDNKEDFSFDIVLPSMPGFFFSDAPDIPNLTHYDCGMILHKLMERLGYDKYYLYGTDWGSVVVRSMALLFPNNVLGVNTPLCGCLRRISVVKQIIEKFIPSWILPKKTKHLHEQAEFLIRNTGYFHFQATYPDVLGVSFAQSPIGFMSHFLTMVIAGHNSTYVKSKATGLDLFEKDILLDQIMLFWATESIASSMRIYKYYLMALYFIEKKSSVPFSCPIIENEIFFVSDWVLSDSVENIIQRSYFNNTGHFYALEKDSKIQDRFANDFVAFVTKTLK